MSNGSSINLYKRLGISQNASVNEIKKAYRDAAKILHPDVNVQAGATELFLSVKEAFEILSDPESKAAYDNDLEINLQQSQTVRIEIEFSSKAIQHTHEKQLIYAHINFEILALNQEEDSQKPPLNVALVLDTSTSMQGARLDVVKATALELLRQFRPQDYLSIITFNDRADVALKAGSHVNIRRAEGNIRGLRASGGTEIFKGLEAGINEIQKYSRGGYTNHIILITDGHTYGDEEDCQQLSIDAANKNIGLSSFGIGGKWNDVLLDNLATRTGGNCIYIQDPHEIREFLTNKISRLEGAYTDQISLNFTQGTGTYLNYAFRLSPEVGLMSTISPLRLGSLSVGSRQQLLFEFVIDPIPTDVKQALLLGGDFTFDIPSNSKSYRIPVSFTLPTTNEVVDNSPSPVITKALSKLTLYRMQEDAKLDILQGKLEQAKHRLKNVATHLLSQGEIELARTVVQEAERLESNSDLSEEGKKQIKYGTRNLLAPGKHYQEK